ncbi:MAG: hypothetical protein PHO08_02965 [Methylococcales bacterium]|nr:hypothetical protein [Methylococcales bacterium]MDD5632928.1 hypothetical protein [Methylococcales bacterium]
MNELSILLCGKHDGLGELSDILVQLATTIDDFAPRCYFFIQNESPDITTFGAYCGRTLLETACTILIGRITPYRLLLLKRCQQHPDYSIGVRHNVAIQWSGDVMPDKKASPDTSWNKIDGYTHPLFSYYMAEIHWIPAFNALLDDFVNEESTYLNDLKKIDPKGVINSFKTEANKLYSSLSKGIHQEFVVPISLNYDPPTVKELLTETIALVTKMALVSHYIPTIATKLDKDTLLRHLVELEKKVDI